MINFVSKSKNSVTKLIKRQVYFLILAEKIKNVNTLAYFFN